jgi:hypothetical protein
VMSHFGLNNIENETEWDHIASYKGTLMTIPLLLLFYIFNQKVMSDEWWVVFTSVGKKTIKWWFFI